MRKKTQYFINCAVNLAPKFEHTSQFYCQFLDTLVISQERALFLVSSLNFPGDLGNLALQLIHFGPQDSHEVALILELPLRSPASTSSHPTQPLLSDRAVSHTDRSLKADPCHMKNTALLIIGQVIYQQKHLHFRLRVLVVLVVGNKSSLAMCGVRTHALSYEDQSLNLAP